jgi:Ca2+-binding RTX toxin-like protein
MALIVVGGYGSGNSITELRGNLDATATATSSQVTFYGTAFASGPTPYPFTAYARYSGTGLTVDANNRFVSGTVQQFVSDYNADFYGLSMSAATIGVAQASANPGQAIWAVLSSGDDQIYAVSQVARYVFEFGYTMDAGTGNDLVNSVGGGADIIYGGSGANTIFAGGGSDFVVAGDLSSSVPTSSTVWSYVDGGAGNDTILSGYGANASLNGGAGNDVLIDSLGTDILNGGAGVDYLAAGSGVNIFDFNVDSIIGSEYDVVDYFGSATNYLSLPSAYQGAFAFTQLGANTLVSLSTYYLYILNTQVSTVVSHTFYD